MSKSTAVTDIWRAVKPHRGLAVGATALLAVVAFVLGGLLWGGSPAVTVSEKDHAHAVDASSEPTAWTCSMHPQIQLPQPGKCPICFMDLIPVETGGGEELGPRQLRLSETARELARIETSTVFRARAEHETRMIGRVGYDETRVANLTAWVPGRLERLYADFTGITVSKGDPLVTMYSPELIASQEELLQAKQATAALRSSPSSMLRSTAAGTLEAARKRLSLFGLSDEQIADLESSGQTSDILTIEAPIGGVVVHKNAREGMYVKTGTQIYTIADLSHLWVLFEAYESDLPWLTQDQTVAFVSTSFPGETFDARISFIDPVVDPATRTVKVRAELNNRDGKFKPDMFVRGTSVSGVVGSGEDEKAPLLIPASAPLFTGKRSIVYVELSDDDGPLYEGRVVELGPRAGEFYVVRTGLEEGDEVVTNGAFKIDSELQIRAKPSMMSAGPVAEADAATVRLAETNEVRAALGPVYDAYFAVQMALAKDTLDDAVAGAGQLKEAIDAVDMHLFSAAGHMRWMALSADLKTTAATIEQSNDIGTARDGFYHLSLAAIKLQETFGHGADSDYYLTYCPMARDNAGAYWLQTEPMVWNSFYGAAMLRCGESKAPLPPGMGQAK
ncbi:MAG: efflux RND transporter periplasmic adaptor subunit [candidate division Zixibacteria bacterium]|nr:efflux RND transporter periplasmic adaptor subunit [candidate division Zixibacteria bacterium]